MGNEGGAQVRGWCQRSMFGNDLRDFKYGIFRVKLSMEKILNLKRMEVKLKWMSTHQLVREEPENETVTIAMTW